jgi:hypothetical protein
MPSMGWEAFQRDHHRPHLLIVRMDAKGEPSPLGAKANLQRLAATLGASGNYAIKAEGTTIYAAFEKDADAARLAALLRPTRTTREWEWASKTFARMDDAAYQRIATILQKRPLKASKRR